MIIERLHRITEILQNFKTFKQELERHLMVFKGLWLSCE